MNAFFNSYNESLACLLCTGTATHLTSGKWETRYLVHLETAITARMDEPALKKHTRPARWKTIRYVELAADVQ